MSTFEDGLWTHLVEQHAADRVRVPVPAMPKRTVRSVAMTTGAVVLAGVIAVLVLVFTASTSPSPAYALTRIAGDSYRVRLYDVAKGVPALNARFAELGLRVTAVPIKVGCTASSFEPVEAAPGALAETVTVTNRAIPAGYRGYIAAEQLPNHRIGLALGNTTQPIPSCFPATKSHGIPGPVQRHTR